MAIYAKTCKRCGAPFEARRPHAEFCSDKCRVYYHLYDQYDAAPAAGHSADPGPTDESIGAALAAARSFTPVTIADHKTVAAIRVSRPGPDPNDWKVSVPANSAVAAGRIYDALFNHIGDLVSLANKLGAEADKPRVKLQTVASRKK